MVCEQPLSLRLTEHFPINPRASNTNIDIFLFRIYYIPKIGPMYFDSTLKTVKVALQMAGTEMSISKHNFLLWSLITILESKFHFLSMCVVINYKIL